MARCARARATRNGGSRECPQIMRNDARASAGRWRAAVISRRHVVPALVAIGLLVGGLPAGAPEKSITMCAAASMKNALDDLNTAFQKSAGIKVVSSYAASSALPRQIEQGAPADI